MMALRIHCSTVHYNQFYFGSCSSETNDLMSGGEIVLRITPDFIRIFPTGFEQQLTDQWD